MNSLTDLYNSMSGAELLLAGVLVALSLDLATYLIQERFYLPFTVLTILTVTALVVYEFQVQQMPDLTSGVVPIFLVMAATIALCSAGKALSRAMSREPVYAAIDNEDEVS